MMRTALTACGPWLAALGISFLVAYLVLRLSGARLDLRRVFHLHNDQAGSAQSLSFVLALPLFIWVLMVIVQISQIMIGIMVVHYAAYATARSAIVWIPARLVPASAYDEHENCISSYIPDPASENQIPISDTNDPNFGPTAGGMTYLINPGSPKYEKIASAAILACMPLSPSRDYKYPLSAQSVAGAEIIQTLYRSMAPKSTTNAAVTHRLESKLAYASANTKVEIRFYHSNLEPPLMPYPYLYDPQEYFSNEVGWRDPITVTVRYNMALLPGVGRLLSNVNEVLNLGPVYVRELTASATMANEGEKSVMPREYHVY